MISSTEHGISRVIVLAPAPLAQSLSFALGSDAGTQAIIAEPGVLDSLHEAAMENLSAVIIHLSSLGQEPVSLSTTGSAYKNGTAFQMGADLICHFRRDRRFGGRIIMTAFQPWETLAATQPLLSGLPEADLEHWNLTFVQLPQQCRVMIQPKLDNLLLSQHQLTEFVCRYCASDAYFSTAWSASAHRLQGRGLETWLREPELRLLLRNTHDFGPLCAWSASPPDALLNALYLLEQGVDGGISIDAAGAWTAVTQCQAWCSPAPVILERTDRVPERAPDDCSLILIADDDEYDVGGLQARGYRTIQAITPQRALQDILDEQPDVFLCDLTWGGDQSIGLSLVRRALQEEVPIVILMSAGAISSNLPVGVVPCTGLTQKHDANYVHQLIARTWQARSRTR